MFIGDELGRQTAPLLRKGEKKIKAHPTFKRRDRVESQETDC